MDFVNSECHQILLPNCFNKRQTFIGIEGHSINLIESKVQYTPSVSTIILSGPTYSSQNVRQMSDKFESQHSLSLTIGCRSVALSCPFYLVKDCYFSELELYQSNSVQSGYQCHHFIKKLLVLAMVQVEKLFILAFTNIHSLYFQKELLQEESKILMKIQQW